MNLASELFLSLINGYGNKGFIRYAQEQGRWFQLIQEMVIKHHTEALTFLKAF